MRGMAEVAVSSMASSRPPITSVNAATEPRYGTATISMPARFSIHLPSR
jgi:hypothetical protein